MLGLVSSAYPCLLVATVCPTCLSVCLSVSLACLLVSLACLPDYLSACLLPLNPCLPPLPVSSASHACVPFLTPSIPVLLACLPVYKREQASDSLSVSSDSLFTSFACLSPLPASLVCLTCLSVCLFAFLPLYDEASESLSAYLSCLSPLSASFACLLCLSHLLVCLSAFLICLPDLPHYFHPSLPACLSLLTCCIINNIIISQSLVQSVPLVVSLSPNPSTHSSSGPNSRLSSLAKRQRRNYLKIATASAAFALALPWENPSSHRRSESSSSSAAAAQAAAAETAAALASASLSLSFRLAFRFQWSWQRRRQRQRQRLCCVHFAHGQRRRVVDCERARLERDLSLCSGSSVSPQ